MAWFGKYLPWKLKTRLARAENELQRYQGLHSSVEDELARVRDLHVSSQNQVALIRDRYLSLLESCLCGTIYDDPGLETCGGSRYDPEVRKRGRDWPSRAHSMIGRMRLSSLRELSEKVICDGIAGDFMETGVWRGGACILMRAVLGAYNVSDRRVWVVDSFEGLPPPDTEQYPEDEGCVFHTYPDLSVSLEQVKGNFEKYGLLDDQVIFLKGWFQDTLPTAPVERLAILRLDGDMYQSTIVPLNALYHKVSEGGFVIVDDYHMVDQSKTATHDFFEQQGISPELREIDGVGVYWQKTSS